MLMNYHIGRLVLSSLCVGAFVAADIWWCSFCRLKHKLVFHSSTIIRVCLFQIRKENKTGYFPVFTTYILCRISGLADIKGAVHM